MTNKGPKVVLTNSYRAFAHHPEYKVFLEKFQMIYSNKMAMPEAKRIISSL